MGLTTDYVKLEHLDYCVGMHRNNGSTEVLIRINNAAVWCMDQWGKAGDTWRLIDEGAEVVFSFSTQEHALEFRLTWC
jgi:hypothetical protein